MRSACAVLALLVWQLDTNLSPRRAAPSPLTHSLTVPGSYLRLIDFCIIARRKGLLGLVSKVMKQNLSLEEQEAAFVISGQKGVLYKPLNLKPLRALQTSKPQTLSGLYKPPNPRKRPSSFRGRRACMLRPRSWREIRYQYCMTRYLN